MSDEEGFLNRWSRRKAAAAKGDPLDDGLERTLETGVDGAEDGLIDAGEPETEIGKTDEEIIEEFGLTPPEALSPGDNVAGYMQKGVPDALRRRALRAIYRLDPTLANLDALVEYGEDFTDAATVVGVLKTAYEAGAGYKKLFAEWEEEAKALDDEAPIDNVDDGAVTAHDAEPHADGAIQEADAPEPAPEDQADEEASALDQVAAADASVEDETPLRRPRRTMRFEVD